MWIFTVLITALQGLQVALGQNNLFQKSKLKHITHKEHKDLCIDHKATRTAQPATQSFVYKIANIASNS
jgi:hypothetical protein